jgi:hypothetical protein
VDTWHILEQRFHEIGNRDQHVPMTFAVKNSEECWYSLHGPNEVYSGNGIWRIVLEIPPATGSIPTREPDFATDHYSVTELWETLRRAGRLLNAQEVRDCGDLAGASRFVKQLVKRYDGLLHEDEGAKFFVNAARVCGMLAGEFANRKPEKGSPKTSRNRSAERPNAARDSQWYDWRHIDGLTDAQIRDRWDAENPCNPVPRENAENGLGVVASAIRREEKRKSQGTS